MYMTDSVKYGVRCAGLHPKQDAKGFQETFVAEVLQAGLAAGLVQQRVLIQREFRQAEQPRAAEQAIQQPDRAALVISRSQ